MKKILSLCLVLALCVSLVPVSVFASEEPTETGFEEALLPVLAEEYQPEEAEEPTEEMPAEVSAEEPTEDEATEAVTPADGDAAATSGSCGDDLTWTLDGDGTLTISGTGATWDWESKAAMGWTPNLSPWCDREAVKTVVIEEGVTAIGKYAFFCCCAEEITVAGSVKTISEDAFADCDYLKKVHLNEGLTSIGSVAFSGCTELTEIRLPDSLQSMGNRVFYNCSALAEINIPDKLTEVCDSTFYGCTALEKVTLGSGLTRIGEKAFSGCTALTEIDIPADVSTIAASAFSGCEKLNRVSVGENVSTIGSYAFSECSSLAEITLPEGVTTIAKRTFDGCSSLSSVSVSDKLGKIGDYAFHNCLALTEFVIPDTVTKLGTDAFYGSGLTKITVPGSVTDFGSYVFAHCSNLSAVTLCAGLATIGGGAFYDCDALTEIVIPDSVVSIGSSAFENCDNLASVILSDQLTKLENRLFQDCSSLQSIAIPENVTAFGENLFSGCSSLTGITIPEGVITLGANAFNGCGSLTEIAIPHTVETIGGSAFSSCTNLWKVTLSDKLTAIGGYLFYKCGALREITLPDGVTELGEGVFYGCSALETITIPDKVTAIKTDTFRDCGQLVEIVIPASVTYIYAGAFKNTSPDLVWSVESDSYAETYAINKGYAYRHFYRVFNTIQVNLNAQRPADYVGAILTASNGTNAVCRTVDGAGECSTFRNLPLGECTLTLRSPYGDELAQTSITVEKADQTVTLDPVGVTTVEACISGAEGASAEGVGFVWLAENGMTYATGAVLTGVPVGKSLRCCVTLSESLARRYVAGTADFVVPDSGGICTVTLSPRERYTVSGKILCDGEAAAGASVTVTQTLDDKYTVISTAVTGGDGCFVLNAYGGAVSLSVERYGYASETVEIGDLRSDTVTEDINLRELTGAVITISGTYRRASEADNGETEAITDTGDLLFTIYNSTKASPVEEVVIQGMNLILPVDVEAGDQLTISAESISGGFAPAECTVVMDGENCAAAELTLIERGYAELSAPRSSNEEDRVLVFNADGELVWTGTGSAESGIETDYLDAGNVKIVGMGSSDYVGYPKSTSMLEEMGLREGTDYVCAEAEIRDGGITTLALPVIPFLDESRFYYTSGDDTTFYLGKSTMDKGKYTALYAQTQMQEPYREQAADFAWVLELPEGLVFAEGSVTVGGNEHYDYWFDGNTMTIPVSSPEDRLRLYLVGAEEGEWEVSGYLRFTLEGRTIVQSVGEPRVKIGASAFSFDLPGKTDETHISLSGVAPVYATIEFYDNDILVCRTQASAAGNWTAEFELYKPYTYSKHNIYAIVRPLYGSSFRSGVQEVIYQYIKEPLTVEKVTMLNTAHGSSLSTLVENRTVFDFQNENAPTGYYNFWPTYPTFTFLIEFSGDTSGLTDLLLTVYCSNGSTQDLDMVWSESQQCYVATGDFTAEALPVSVGVEYDTGAPLILSAEEETESAEAYDRTSDMLNDTSLKDAIDELGQTLEEAEPGAEALAPYEQLRTEYEKFENEKNALISELGIEVYSDCEAGVTIGDDRVTIRQTTVTMSDAELTANGYEKYVRTDGSCVYVRLPDGAGEIRMNVYDPSTGTLLTAEMENAGTDGISVDGAGESVGDAVMEWLSASDKAITNLSFACERFEQSAEAAVKYYEMDGLYSSPNALKISKGIGTSLNVASKALGAISLAANYADLVEIEDKIQVIDIMMLSDPENMELKKLRDAYYGQSVAAVLLGVGDIVGLCTPVIGPVGLGVGFGIYAVSMLASYQKDQLDAQYEKLRAAYKAKQAAIAKENAERKAAEEAERRKEEIKKIKREKCYKALSKNLSNFGNDPSGYVYEAVTSNRIEGVTATLYQQVTTTDIYEEEHTTVELWDAGPYEQENPLTTDALGQYRWDVPDGLWQVRYEKAGYETAYSDWLTVPPPQTDVNVGMVNYAAPTVTECLTYTDYVELTFSRYLKIGTVDTDSVKILCGRQTVSGHIEFVNAEESPDGAVYVSDIKYVFDEPQTAGTTVTVCLSEKLESYAGVNPTGEISLDVTLQERPQTLEISDVAQLYTGSTVTVTLKALPASAAAGKTLTVTSVSSLFAVNKTALTLDKNGEATLELTAQLPGTAVLTVVMDGTNLTAQSDITIVDRYTIQFVSGNGKLLQTDKLFRGDVPSYTGTTPKKAATETLYYIFTGWDADFAAATGDTVYQAMFTAKERADANDDGRSDALDLIALMNYLVGNTDTLGGSYLNGDGEVNLLDLVWLMKAAANRAYA